MSTEAAQRIHEKFGFYTVGLAFAVLALAVQTASHSPSAVVTFAELLGRAALLVSGLAGLYRLEGLPYSYLGNEAIAQDTHALRETKRMIAAGQKTALDPETHQPKDLGKHKAEVEAHREGLSSAAEKLLGEARTSYRLHRYSLIVGLGLLTLSRSWADIKWLVAVTVAPR